tara:strand:+ start:90 stop:1067 length:978 start_codon:yes stop_codon:yes gene_type:complete
MNYITVTKDLGKKETYDAWNGKFLDESSYDQVIKVTDEDAGIMKPVMSLDGSDVPLAYVITNAYGDDSVRNTLMSIEDVSVMRANCSGPILEEDMLAKGLVKDVDYRLRTPNSYQLKTGTGKWGMIAYSNEIHSVMIGYKRGRFTGGIDSSGWVKTNKKKWEELQVISEWNEKAFIKANKDVYDRQKAFCETYIEPEYRIGGGIFTTLSANRYHIGQSGKMGAHVDSGDLNAGMTTMSCFREGEYGGAYLVFPRYGIAIDAPDNSVIIADSNEVHGVTQITGTGQRFTCVAYCDNRLATKGVAGKSERKIGRFAKNESGSLEDFV